MLPTEERLQSCSADEEEPLVEPQRPCAHSCSCAGLLAASGLAALLLGLGAVALAGKVTGQRPPEVTEVTAEEILIEDGHEPSPALRRHPQWRQLAKQRQQPCGVNEDQTGPCTTQVHKELSFFCFSVMFPGGWEEELIRLQYERNISIFACDTWRVVSVKHMWVGEGKAGEGRGFFTVPMPNLHDKRGIVGVNGAETNGYLNSMTFVNAWKKLLEEPESTLLLHDFVCKVDPDAVFFPDRLPPHVKQFAGKAVYIQNCQREAPKLYGSLEVFSAMAVTKFMKNSERCKKLPYWGWGEDEFMQKCMDSLGVQGVQDLKLVADGSCTWGQCSDWYRVAFHGFKAANTYFQCYDIATR